MSPPSSSDDSSGPPDRQTLRLLERRLADDPLVTETAFDPDSTEPRVLEVHVDSDQFPPSVDAVRLDIRWYTTDDFSIHYIETATDGTHWECRWDRHPNPHNARLHFHRPPDAAETVDLELSSLHLLDVLSTVLAPVEDRLERMWDANS